MILYNDKVLHYYEHHGHAGAFPKNEPDVITVQEGHFGVGDVMRLQMKLKNERVIDARYKTHGSAYAMAVCAYLCEQLIGKTLIEAQAIDANHLISALDLPGARQHCARQAEDLLMALLWSKR